MAGFIVYAGMNINYIANEINVNKPYEHNTSNYIGAAGSNTNFVSSGGRVISFKSVCQADEQSAHNRGHRIKDYKALVNEYTRKAAVLVSESKSNIDGNYIITKFDYTEDTGGNYLIDWEFTEVKKFNVTKKTFRVWGKAISNDTTNKKTSTKSSNSSTNLNANVKYLLKSCPLMTKGDKGKCVKSLQKFLQSKGYYKGYKVDGSYETYTEKAVKNLQKKFKLKATGKWDKKTRAYFQKKYKYPTAVEKKWSNAMSRAAKVTGG